MKSLGINMSLCKRLGGGASTLALSLAFTTATIASTGAPDADSGTTTLSWTNPGDHRMQYDRYGVLQYAPHNLAAYSELMTTDWTTLGSTQSAYAGGDEPSFVSSPFTYTMAAGTTNKWVFKTAIGPRNIVRAKAGTLDFVCLSSDGPTTDGAFFDLANGTVETESGGTVGTIIDEGNGWYTCVADFTDAAEAYLTVSFHSADNQAQNWNATGGETIHIGAPQKTLSPCPYTYIATTSSAVYGARAGTDNRKPVTNKFRYPENQNATTIWVTDNATVSDGQTDPFGGTRAIKLVENSTSNPHAISNTDSIDFVSGKTYTFSAFFKPDERGFARIDPHTAYFPANTHAYFNVNTGEKGTLGAGADSSGMAAVPGTEYYRCWLTATADATGNASQTYYFGMSNADNTSSYLGDGSSGLFISHPMLNEGGIRDYVGSHNLLLDNDPDADKNFASWTVGINATVNTDDRVAPDGTTTMDQLIDNNSTGTGNVLVQESYTTTSGSTYEFRVYAAADQLDWLVIRTDWDSGGNTNFDLTNGVTGVTSSIHTPEITFINNGIYECKVRFTVKTGSFDTVRCYVAEADNDFVVDLDGTSSIHLWGAELKLLKTAEQYDEQNTTEVSDSAWSDVSVGTGSATIDGDDVTIVGTDGSNRGQADKSFSTTIGQWYVADISVVVNSGLSTWRFGTSSDGQENFSNNIVAGTNYAIFQATATTTYLTVRTTSAGGNQTFAYGAVKPITLSTADYPPCCMPATGYVQRGYTSEDSATNLCTESDDFTTTWTNSAPGSLTITANQGVGSDGLTTLDKIEITDTSVEAHGLGIQVTLAADTDSVCAMDIRDDGVRYIGLLLYGANEEFAVVVFDTLAGTAVATDVGTTSGTINDYGVIRQKNGLLRLWVSGQISVANPFWFVETYNSTSPTFGANGAESYAGTAGDAFYAGGVQIETGTYPTSLIKTDGGTETRTGDDLTEATLSWYNQAEGTIVVEGSTLGSADNTHYFYEIHDGTANNRLLTAAGGTVHGFVFNSPVIEANIDAGSFAASGARGRAAFAFGTDAAVSLDGGAVATDASVTLPTLTTLTIGKARVSSYLDGSIRSLQYYSERKSDADLATLSTITSDGSDWLDERLAA